MDQVVKTLSPISARRASRGLQGHANARPSREEAEAAAEELAAARTALEELEEP